MQVVDDHVFAGHIELWGGDTAEEYDDIMQLAEKCETDRWAGIVVCGGLEALRIMSDAVGFEITGIRLQDLAFAAALPEPVLLVYNEGHWVPFWRADVEGQSQCRPWLPADSTQGFSGPFIEEAARLGCFADVTTRAGGDCLFHGFARLADMITRWWGKMPQQMPQPPPPLSTR